MKLHEAKLRQTLRGTSGDLYRVRGIDPVGANSTGYTVTIEHLDSGARVKATKDRHVENLTPLMEATNARSD